MFVSVIAIWMEHGSTSCRSAPRATTTFPLYFHAAMVMKGGGKRKASSSPSGASGIRRSPNRYLIISGASTTRTARAEQSGDVGSGAGRNAKRKCARHVRKSGARAPTAYMDMHVSLSPSPTPPRRSLHLHLYLALRRVHAWAPRPPLAWPATRAPHQLAATCTAVRRFSPSPGLQPSAEWFMNGSTTR